MILRPLALLVLLAAPFAAQASDVTVFAAASLKTALDDIAARYHAETGNTANVSLAGSSALARQIQQGAPADVFISANAGWMDRLQADGLIDADSRIDLLANRLVLIAHDPDAPPVDLASGDLSVRLNGGKLAMALVDAVPAGIYGKAALETLGHWQTLEPHVAQADNVRAALALVALGAAPYGIVYATDASADPRVTIVATFPADSHPPITYPAATLSRSKNPAKGDFLSYLTSAPARAAFKAQGFTVLVE
ncbi:molybdate ABC transporter substrate-binding protein [Mesobacterium sp. TK19101]|uniref:Molybdate ABC transporter substrate-binding protein n=1 Tax=Mesobacterium hydrothermale TaxID=3111907 RepID=A0ABU6HGW8_9RHOB|nr:molybdate ABC transporter substrate-binding protein [Mesobacterium sp. TK19101]MEC3861707.1 molybdate ABC transporter substrate-binding protein [Mesobacterium sp. TK19101]